MTSLTKFNLLLKIFLDYLASQIWCILIKLGLLLLVIFIFNIHVLTNNTIQIRTSAPEFGIVSHPKYANCQKKQFRKKVQEIQPICCFFMLRTLTVPLETTEPCARGKTSSLPNVFTANSPRWDENRNRRVWKGGSWSRIPAPFLRESHIPHVFHQFPTSRFSFPEKYIKKSNFYKS